VIVAPAVDLRGGRCVQLVGGRPEDERVSLPDPVAAARRWWDAGFGTLHVVDLDAALGEGDNRDLVEALCRATAATVQVGGGLRDDEAVDGVLGSGADRVIVGTRAVEDRGWLEALARGRPGRIMVAADVRDGRVLRKGWTEASTLRVLDFVADLGDVPLAGVLCTDVGREGRLAGVDGDAMAAVVAASPHPVWASGGIADVADLRRLERAGAAGAVVGMALYTGSLDPVEVAREFGGGGSPRPETSEERRTRR
jgi:phosphoribosylformimino-5-aminoimidazole carboxamide ribotide isomerase